MAPAFQVLVQGCRYRIYGPDIEGSKPKDPDPMIYLPNGQLWRCYGPWWHHKECTIAEPSHMGQWRYLDEKLPERIFKAVRAD